jgi:RNA polymerase sigma-70 factor, ECF subfamily
MMDSQNEPGDLPTGLEQLRTFSELVLQFQAPVRAYLAGFVRDADAVDDLAQETFLSAYKNFARFEGRSKVLTWLTGIARNKALHYLRDSTIERQRTGRTLGALLMEWRLKELEVEKQQNIRLHALEGCLKKLPVRSAELVREYYSGVRTSEEVGREFGKNPAAIRAAILRLRQVLKECVETAIQKEAI